MMKATANGIKRIISLRCTLAMILFIPVASVAQQVPDVIPDGTQGEQLEVVPVDTLPQKWRDKRWRLFPGKFSTFKFGGGFLYEFAGYKQDGIAKQQMDSIGSQVKPAFAVRDFRITLSGQLKKTRLTISWKAGFMYDDANRQWLVRETGVMVDVPELWGKFFIGRTKEGFSLNKVMVGYAGWTMERQMALDVIPILADGIKWMGYLPKHRIFWNAGVFVNWLSKNQSFSTFKWQTAWRAGILPIYHPEKNEVLHLGFSYRYGVPVNSEIRLRSRPEADPVFHFIDTEKFPSHHSNQVGGEAYYCSGPLMVGSEIYWHGFNSSQAGDPVFFGGEGVVSYMITGESRPYHTSTAILGFVPVKKSVFKGGPGAWEVLVRFSSLNLTSGNLHGGKFWRFTPMVNWYMSKEVRLELAYGYGMLDRFNLKGATQFFQARIQLALL